MKSLEVKTREDREKLRKERQGVKVPSAIVLNSGQQEAFKMIIQNFYETGFMLLSGEAGTGKTLVLVEAINQLVYEQSVSPQDICLAVPTHKLVEEWGLKLKELGLSFVQIKTVHSLTKFFPDVTDKGDRPLVSFEERNNTEGKVLLPFKLLIVDEAFMLPKPLVQAIYSHGYLASVLAGDPNQTVPIHETRSHLTEITDFNFKCVLSQNMRQKYIGLKNIVEDINQKGKEYNPEKLNKSEFRCAFFKSVAENSKDTVFLAYRNHVCRDMSDMVRSVQGVNNLDLADVGEELKISGLMHQGKVQIPANSIVQVKEVDEKTNEIFISYRGLMHKIKVDLSCILETSLTAAKLAQDKKIWKAHYDLCDQYPKLYHTCVSTVHSSQGMTIKNVFLSWSDICSCTTDPNLCYVAASRCSENLYFG